MTASGATLATYTVPVPQGIGCAGLGSLANPRITWNAVTPLAGDSVVYVVTPPSGAPTVTATPSYRLPVGPTVPGQYRVQARISSGWLSQVTTITATVGARGLYACTTP